MKTKNDVVITIVSAYTWFNKGDAGILMGTLTELNEYFRMKEVRFNILSFTPDIDKINYEKFFPNISKVNSNIFNPYPVKKNKFHKGIAIMKLGIQYVLKKSISKISPKFLESNDSVKLCKNSDLLIICGGGFLGGNKYNSLIHLAQMDILKNLNRPMILWGTSIEPPSKRLLKKITEKVLSNVDVILPREKITEDYLKSFYSLQNIIPTPDMAFKTPEIFMSKKIDKVCLDIRKQAMGKRVIGITMREWFFPKSKEPEKQKKQYEESLIELIDDLDDECTFVFVPQVIMNGDDDRIFANEIKNGLVNSNNLIVLEEDYSPYELKYLISKFDQFLGTRMHSNIFASTVSKAPVAIAYEKKTNGIMEKLNLAEYVVDIEKVNSNILKEMLNNNNANAEKLSKEVSMKVQELKMDIRDATKKVFDRMEL